MPGKDNLVCSLRRRGRFSMYLENRHAVQAKLGPSLSCRTKTPARREYFHDTAVTHSEWTSRLILNQGGLS